MNRVTFTRRTPAEQPAERRSSLSRVLTFALGLALLAVVLLAATPDVFHAPDRAWQLPFLVLVLAFAGAEATALHVEIRKESHSLSLSAIPLMFGALYTSPMLLALAYMIGGAPVLLWVRRADPVKSLWNTCLFFSEAALVAVIVRSVLGPDLPADAVEWLVPLAAVLAAELMSLVAVSLVIMLVDAKFRPNLFADVGRSQILAALGGSFTVTAIAASVGSPTMLLYALVPTVGIGMLLRSSGQLVQRFADLQKLHSFTRALTNERGSRTLDIGLAHLVEIMRSRGAGLVIGGEDGSVGGRALVDESFATIDHGKYVGLFLDLVDVGGVTLLTRHDLDERVDALLDHLGASTVLAARVLGEVDRSGVLYVSDRLGMRHEFSTDEIRLFGSLTDTLSSRLTNDYLVEQLEEQAQHDALTGLPNRLNFEIALTARLADPAQSGVVLMIDLDRFKEINDSLGHDTGDRLLVEVARRLQRVTRATDVVARFGGDEFAVLLTTRNPDGTAALRRQLDDLHRRLVERVDVDEIMFDIGASIGVAEWPLHGTDSGTLLRRADFAMYDAKRNQRGVVWYRPELDADAPRKLELSQAVRTALDDLQVFVHLQPKVSTADGRIAGVEALARWTHPVHGPISPVEFVPMMAQVGLTGRLTRYIVERAVEAAVSMRSVGIGVPIAVNLTPRDLLDPALPGDLAAILANAGLDARSLEVEITEDAMVVDFAASELVLRRIRDLGIRVALDDFGTGYSSLQHLHRLPVDELKIDRSFIGRLNRESSAVAIVRAAIIMAEDLGLSTVAEGVEDLDTFAAVAQLGCGLVQGYCIAAPIPPADFLRWARAWEMFEREQMLDRIGSRSDHALT